VAPQPWRSEAAEAYLPDGAARVTDALLSGAKPTPDNGFKLTLARRALGSVLMEARA